MAAEGRIFGFAETKRVLSLKGEGVQGSQGQWISMYSKIDSLVMVTSRVSASSEM